MTSKGLCLLALTASFVGSVACSSDSTAEKAGNVEVFSWWTAGGEKNAFDDVVALHVAKYPKVTVTNASIASVSAGEDARAELQTRMDAGDPPDLFQANIGADLLHWGGAQSKIEDLTPIVNDAGLQFYDDIIKDGNLSEGGALRGIPVNIHRINSLFLNVGVLNDHGVDPASIVDLASLHAACDTLMTDTALAGCMSIGSVGKWTLDIMIFQSVLPSVAGGTFYEDYFRGSNTAPGTDPNIVAMLDETETLWSYMPTGANSPNTIDWVPAIDLFISGQVGMTIMGDWAKGLIDADGTLAPETGYLEGPFPGTEAGTPPFIYTADTFALPIGAQSRDLAIDFLKTFASDEGAVAFNSAKGSIPARALADSSGFDAVTTTTIDAWTSSTDRHVALSGIAPGDYAMSDSLFEYISTVEAGTPDRSIITTALEDNYHWLQ